MYGKFSLYGIRNKQARKNIFEMKQTADEFKQIEMMEKTKWQSIFKFFLFFKLTKL